MVEIPINYMAMQGEIIHIYTSLEPYIFKIHYETLIEIYRLDTS